MNRGYLIFGLVVCSLLAYANFTGWTVADSAKGGRWGPSGPNVYHK